MLGGTVIISPYSIMDECNLVSHLLVTDREIHKCFSSCIMQIIMHHMLIANKNRLIVSSVRGKSCNSVVKLHAKLQLFCSWNHVLKVLRWSSRMMNYDAFHHGCMQIAHELLSKLKMLETWEKANLGPTCPLTSPFTNCWFYSRMKDQIWIILITPCCYANLLVHVYAFSNSLLLVWARACNLTALISTHSLQHFLYRFMPVLLMLTAQATASTINRQL